MSFYKGNTILEDPVIKNYLKGLYSNKYGEKIPLKQGMNKYNIEHIKKVNELNYKFYRLILIEEVVLKLLNMNSEKSYGEKGNIYNLMKAQGGTIRYNRLFKKALKTYTIDRKDVNDSIIKDIEKQEQRVERNKIVLLSLLSDYGFDVLIQTIKIKTGMEIFDHIEYFFNQLELDIAYGADRDKTEATDKYYDNLTNKYTEFISTLATEEGIGLDNGISESLKAYRDRKYTAIKEMKEKKKEEKKNSERQMALNIVRDNNIKINNDLVCNEFDTPNILSRQYISGIVEKIRLCNGTCYYISAIKRSRECYVKYTIKGYKLSSTVTKENLFSSKEKAEEAVKELQAPGGLLDGYIVTVQSLRIIGEFLKMPKQDNIIKHQVIKNSLFDTMFKESLTGFNDIAFAKRALVTVNNGIIIDSIVEVVIYQLINKGDINDRSFGNIYYLSFSNNNESMHKKYCDASIFKPEEVLDGRIMKYLINKYGDTYQVNQLHIKISSDWFGTNLRKLDKFYSDTIKTLFNTDRTINMNLYCHLYEVSNDSFNKFKQEIIKYRNNGINNMWIILCGTCSQFYFYREGSRDFKTHSMAKAKIFLDVNEANSVIKDLYSSGDGSRGTIVFAAYPINLV